MTFSAVLFDLDGTLCEHDDGAGPAAYRRTFEAAGIERFGEPSELWAALDDPPDHDDPVGYFAAGFVRVAAQHGRTPVDAVTLARSFLETVDYTNVRPREGAREAVAAAARIGPVGVVTNGPESRQAGKLDALPFGDAFETTVYAADLPRRKPNREPFDRALAVLDRDPEEVLVVGNALAYDVAGAQNVGCPAAWCPRGTLDPRPYRPDYLFESPADLTEVLNADG